MHLQAMAGRPIYHESLLFVTILCTRVHTYMHVCENLFKTLKVEHELKMKKAPRWEFQYTLLIRFSMAVKLRRISVPKLSLRLQLEQWPYWTELSLHYRLELHNCPNRAFSCAFSYPLVGNCRIHPRSLIP